MNQLWDWITREVSCGVEGGVREEDVGGAARDAC